MNENGQKWLADLRATVDTNMLKVSPERVALIRGKIGR